MKSPPLSYSAAGSLRDRTSTGKRDEGFAMPILGTE
jgi:hypothetical protein